MNPHLDPRPGKVETIVERVAVFIASGFYGSYLPAKLVTRLNIKWGKTSLADRKWTGAGLVGSLWGVVFYLVMPASMAQSFLFIFIGVAAAVLVSHIAEKALHSHDDARIVIDEWIGTWIALWGLSQEIDVTFIIAVVLFRLFDVIKGPWGKALQKLPGGWGIVMDDVAAGLIANLIVRFFLQPW